MKYYLAPLEGVTTYVYRNAYHQHFRKLDKYFTPFIVSHKDKKFNTRELKELSPEHNQGLFVVPQLLTNCAEDFIKTAGEIQSRFGYQEINLNLGCPSPTVVTKNKGSGFLAFPEELDRFLDTIYKNTTLHISIKTRIGKTNPEEFDRLLSIYNQYPLEELIIHPRVQTDFYKNTPNWEVYEEATKHTKHSLCYNGDINTKGDFEILKQRFPDTEKLMCGRGLITNPNLIGEISENETLSLDQFLSFHQMIYEEYQKISSGERNTLFKMKELWFYMSSLFEQPEKYMKKIKKSERLRDYEAAVHQLYTSCPLKSTGEQP